MDCGRAEDSASVSESLSCIYPARRAVAASDSDSLHRIHLEVDSVRVGFHLVTGLYTGETGPPKRIRHSAQRQRYDIRFIVRQPRSDKHMRLLPLPVGMENGRCQAYSVTPDCPESEACASEIYAFGS
jgi:hypothetical protein